MAMNIRNLTGIVTATPTPIRDGKVDVDSVRDLARHLVASGAAGITPIGGTGEYVSLSLAQKLDMVQATCEAVGGAIPTIAGLIAPGLGESLEAGKKIMEAGADGLLLITPYYLRPSQAGIIDYFKAFSDRVDADLVLYEFPYRTNVTLTPETVRTLAETTRVVAMKACNPDNGQQLRVIEAAGDKISILSGDEDVAPMHLAAGARGGLLASSCIIPRIWNRIDALARAGKTAEALALHVRIREFIKVLFQEHNPGPLKAALNLIGRPCGEPLTPLVRASDATVAELGRLLPAMLALEASMA